MSGLAISETTQYLSADSCRLADFVAIVEEQTDPGRYPNAATVDRGVVIYDGAALSARMKDHPDLRAELLTEIASALLSGPGIVAFSDAVSESAVDRVSLCFDQIIEREKQAGGPSGDHFAKPGANDRVWNALEKLALLDAGAFVDYYRSEILALASEAWLGPAYQVTSQVNVVNPGGEAQQPHRDYHLGFMTEAEAARFPSHVHRLSPALTLQGAVAHCDMPTETGPTMYLPHSQKYEAGYLAWRRPDFVEYFADNHVQLPLEKGSAIFFNPAVFHAAGTNGTGDVRRMANLLQVSSAMGRSLERVNRLAMSLAMYPALSEARDEGMAQVDIERAVAASSEGYPFPTDLDHDQPVDGLTPQSQADVVLEALAGGWPIEQLRIALEEQDRVRAS